MKYIYVIMATATMMIMSAAAATAANRIETFYLRNP
jgi:hypothetical protein